MKKVIFQMSVSIHGYMGGPNREIDWHIVDDEFNAYAVETLRATDVLMMGRRAYELMAGYWPTATGDDPVAKEMNGTPKLVFSRTLKRVDWQNSSLATGSVADEVARLKRVPGDGLLGGRKRPGRVVPRTGFDGRDTDYLDAYSGGRR